MLYRVPLLSSSADTGTRGMNLLLESSGTLTSARSQTLFPSVWNIAETLPGLRGKLSYTRTSPSA